MAKMFYTLDEAKQALGKSEEEVKQLSREGRLREFRDGPRLMFKADQVDALKNELSGPEKIDLSASDTGGSISLVDSRAGASSAGSGLISMDPDASRNAAALKEDTALAADLGLSGSLGGMPSPRAASSGSATGLSSHGSRAGVDVFKDDEGVERVDPSAQTAMSSGIDQVNIESIGSGSGLLDLTRESDDTSLGAELLDEIAPGTPRRSAPGDTATGGGIVDTRPVGGSIRTVAVQYEERADPMAPAFGAAALGATAFVILGAFTLISGLLDTTPTMVETISHYSFMILAGAGLGLTLIFFVIGLIVGKSGAR